MNNIQLPKEKVVGLKQTRRSIEKGEAVEVFLAKDADPMLIEQLISLCEAAGVPTNREFSMMELGKACGISVGAATCAIVHP